MPIEGFTDVSDLLGSGIYILSHRGQVVYVGQSKSLYARIYAHRRMQQQKAKGKNAEFPSWLPQRVKGMLFDSVQIRRVPIELLDSLERELISRFKPKHNIQHRGAEAIGTISLVINGHQLKVEEKFERRI